MNKGDLICDKAHTVVGVIGEICKARATIIVLWNNVPEYSGCKTVVLHKDYIELLPVGTKVIECYPFGKATVITYKYYNSKSGELVGDEGAVKAWNLDGTTTLEFDFNDDEDITTKNNSQYTCLGIEPWTIMKKNFTREEFIGFCKCCILKYVLRRKGSDIQDAEKIEHYARKLQELLKEVNDED